MTIGEWLDARLGDAPAPLAERLRVALAGDAARGAEELPERAVGAAERIVRPLLAGGDATRDAALDLLAADALVTYAFEAAADAPDRLVERASGALASLAALAAPAATETRAGVLA